MGRPRYKEIMSRKPKAERERIEREQEREKLVNALMEHEIEVAALRKELALFDEISVIRAKYGPMITGDVDADIQQAADDAMAQMIKEGRINGNARTAVASELVAEKMIEAHTVKDDAMAHAKDVMHRLAGERGIAPVTVEKQ